MRIKNERKENMQNKINKIKLRFDNNVELSKKDIKFLFDVIAFDDEIFQIKYNGFLLMENEIKSLKKELRFRSVKAYPACTTYCKYVKECISKNIPYCENI